MLSLARLSGDETSLQYNLPALIQVGLARLYSMQHLDGDWGWWHDEALIDEEGNPYERFSWEDYGYNNKEIRGSRVIFFITRLKDGRTVITYLARTTQPGVFTALPSELSAMYDAAFWARSESAAVTVTSTLSVTESLSAPPSPAPETDKVEQP